MTDLITAFSALSDATRFQMVERLMREGELPAGRLVDDAGMSAPAVSRHLRVLREAGLVRQRVQGTHRYYSVQPQALQAIEAWVNDTRSFWETSLDRLDALVALEEGGTDA